MSEPAAGVDAANVDVRISLDNAAYVYYTSGSTGLPKGVVLDHRGAMNRLEWLRRRYPLASGNRVVHKTPLIFDVSIWEIFGTLSAGATILLAHAGQEADVIYLRSLLAARGTVFAHFVPCMLDAYLGCASAWKYPELRWVQVSGEALPSRVVEGFSRHFAAAELHSLYGQTETSEVAAWEGREWRGKSGAPIGRQIGIYRLYVLDESLRPVPPGVPGELCVAGVGGLARGYHARAGLTAEKFVPNPFAVCSGERLYRTGDLVVLDDEGMLRFRGRLDEQTKIRGCRVETNEVETTLTRHASVRGCAVVSRQDESGANELVAYIIGERSALHELGAHAERYLPGHMQPAVYVYLPELPQTASGKLDRRALPAPRPSDREARMTGQPPRGALEEQLAEKWRQVLQLQTVARTANFFTIGGNSLKCTQVLSWISASFGIQVSIRDFFLAPTIEGLACAMERSAAEMVNSLHDDEVQCHLQRLEA